MTLRAWKPFQILQVGDAIEKGQHCTSLFPNMLPYAFVKVLSWQKHPTLAHVWYFGRVIS